jgi:signal transduction histidine kinase
VDEELVVGLASAAGVAIENARLHTRLQELGVLEDRERIARDLHDTVIQRLFATGLSLQGSVRLIRTDPEAGVMRIETAVDDLDLTVKHIRSAIFGLETAGPTTAGVRDQVVSLIREASRALAYEPRVLFDGPVDSALGERAVAALVSTLREALSNVARHARGTRVDVEVIASADVCLRVIDDGVGPPADGQPVGNGLRNMATRARELGGIMELRPGKDRGCVLEWRVPRS